MQRVTVASGTLMSVGYEAATSTLELEFSTGEVMQFYNVPLSVYIALTKAASKSDYYHHNIKPLYESKQVTDEEEPNDKKASFHSINN